MEEDDLSLGENGNEVLEASLHRPIQPEREPSPPHMTPHMS